MEVQFAYTILYVDDVSSTATYYNTVFGFEIKFVTPDGDYGEIITGNTTLAFANHELGKSNFSKGYLHSDKGKQPFGFEIAFTTNDVEGLMKKAIDEGGALMSAKQTKPWGQDVGYIRDLNGFIIEICTPMNMEG